MRIAIPLKSHDPTWGGPGTYTMEVVKHLVGVDDRNEYLLLYPNSGAVRQFRGQYAEYPHVDEIEAKGRRGLFWDQVTLPRILAPRRVDLLFSPFMSLPVAGRFKKVMTVPGAERYVVPGLLSRYQGIKWSLMERFMLPAADCVLSFSHAMKRDFCEATGFPAEKVRTVYLGVGQEFQKIEDQGFLDDLRIRCDVTDPFLLFVGHLFPNKNFGNLLRAFHQLVKEIPHNLLVVGGRRWKYKDEVALIASLDLGDRVKFLHFLPREDLVGLYNLADCFVFPSLYESFGLAQLEAMACGCPVVASCTGALPEVAGDSAVLCEPESPEDIATAILKVVSSGEVRRQCVEKGLARAKEFTWTRCAAETLGVLESIALS